MKGEVTEARKTKAGFHKRALLQKCARQVAARQKSANQSLSFTTLHMIFFLFYLLVLKILVKKNVCVCIYIYIYRERERERYGEREFFSNAFIIEFINYTKAWLERIFQVFSTLTHLQDTTFVISLSSPLPTYLF